MLCMSMEHAYTCVKISSILMGIELGKGSCDDTYINVAFVSHLYIAEDECKEY